MAYMAMTEDETELELKCADLGRNEKLMPLNSDQASWIIFLPMKDSSLISSARITLLRRPSWKIEVAPISSRRRSFAQVCASRVLSPQWL
jgi:hypothetical protein